MEAKPKKPEKLAYQVVMDAELLRKAKEKAKAEDLLLSQLIRRFLVDYISNPQGKLFH